MRKFFALLSALSLLVVSFAGCNQTSKIDVWDGSIAEAFAGGDGSEKKPYIINKASQLALLAKEVNSGTDYNGKYISLECNLDLNHCEWKPIGNGNESFNGIFDGNNYTIFNNKITDGANFTTEYSRGETNQYTIGLFGSCYNATIKNITIEKASVIIQNISNVSAVMGGILVGTMSSDSSAEISNVSVVNTDIICSFDLESPSASLRIGGIMGYLFGNDNSSIVLKNINTDTSVSIENGSASYNLIGGIVGAASAQNLFDVNNCASYLSLNIDTQKFNHNYCGAFGSMLAKNDIVSISNVFSKVKTNRIREIFHGYASYNANAIMGETYHGKQKDGSLIGGYKFQNLFGYVEQVDASTGETAKSTQLYELPTHTIYTETNCIGCESLPANHGFDASVWDLTDLSNPKVK